jgi:hypothetical protein
MTLPIFDAMRLVEVGRVPAAVDLTSVLWTEDAPDLGRGMEYDMEYRAQVSIGFSKIGPKEAHDYIKREATKSIAHHIYGPITRELLEISMDLRRRGPDMWPVVERLEKLICDMRGDAE